MKTIQIPQIKAPAFLVDATDGRSYIANNLTIAHHEGRYCLSFISSGGLVILRADEVKAVRFETASIAHCNGCDGPLVSWPCNEPEPEMLTFPIPDEVE